MYGYIYKTTDLTNGKIYVGQKHSDHFIPEYLGSGTNIKQAIEVKGKNNFKAEMIESIDDVDMMDERERYWIAQLHSQDPSIGYNLMPGGAVERRLVGPLNPFYGKHHSEETRAKLSISSSKNHRLHTEQEKINISKALKGRKVTWGDKLSENAWNNPNFGMRGKHLSEESKAKLSASLKETFSDPEYRQRKKDETKSRWQDTEYRRKHIEGMRGKKRKIIPKTMCPKCGKMIINGNLSRHIAAH